MDAPAVTRDDATHVYYAGGVAVPWSVTRILQAAGYIDFSTVPRSVLEAARARGQRVHTACALLADDDLDVESVDPDDLPYVMAASAFLRHTGMRPMAIEPLIYHPGLQYAGAPDLLALDGGEQVCLDYKTGHPGEVATDLQTAAYVLALTTMVPPDQIRPWRRVGIALRETGTYQVEEYRDPQDFNDFLTALAHLNARRRRKG